MKLKKFGSLKRHAIFRRFNYLTGSLIVVLTTLFALRHSQTSASVGRDTVIPKILAAPAIFESGGTGNWLMENQRVTFSVQPVSKATADENWQTVFATDGRWTRGSNENRILVDEGVPITTEFRDFFRSFEKHPVDKKRNWLLSDSSPLLDGTTPRVAALVEEHGNELVFLFGLILVPVSENTSSNFSLYRIHPVNVPSTEMSHLPLEFLRFRTATRWDENRRLQAEIHAMDNSDFSQLLRQLAEIGWQSESGFNETEDQKNVLLLRRRNQLLCVVKSIDQATERVSIVSQISVDQQGANDD